ncbi:MAG TPA: hypothetical protein VK841_09425 [Polyangiaceae bacterium]|jgi:hypothetical protein|nr:hypothetical protein [Polyangiaceae bacterium]
MSAATDLFDANYSLGLPYFPIKNTGASAALTVGMVVKVDASNVLSASQPAVGVIPTAALTDVPFGIVVETSIAAGAYGTCRVIDGTAAWCVVDASGNIAAGAQVMPSSSVSGAVRTYVASAGNSVVGQALTATTAAADPVLVKLQLRGPST